MIIILLLALTGLVVGIGVMLVNLLNNMEKAQEKIIALEKRIDILEKTQNTFQ